MTKSKNTKRALLASILSIMLCMAMLIGSTFAWFTDNVTSGKNKIVAGNLDIQLNYKNVKMAADGENFAEVLPTTENLFVNSEGNDIRWEPGAAAVTYLELKNAGNLALKYQLSVDAKDTVVGSDGAALSRVLKTAVVEIAETEVGTYDRATAVQKAKAADAESILGYKKPGEMTEQGQVKYLAMIVYFPEEIGNTYEGAVYNRSDVELKIELSLNLVATQMPYEKDSFGKDYDANAEYDGEVSTEASLVAAIEKGGSYKLAKDINLSQSVNVADGTTVVLNLNGKNLSYDSDYAIINKGDLTIDGDGSIKGRGGIKSTAGKLTINGGIYTASSDYTQGSYQHALKAENTEVVINGGTFGNDSAKPNAIINVAGGSNMTINGGTFKNVTGALSRFDPYLFTYENDGKLIINDGTFYGGWRFNAATATTDIYGGNFTVTYDGQSFNAGNTHVLTVYGGNFTPVTGVTTSLANKLSDVVAEGYSIVDNADGTKTVLESGISGDIDNEVGDPFGD